MTHKTDRYEEGLKEALWHLWAYHNHSVSPWLIEEYGLEKVEKDLTDRYGSTVKIRVVQPKEELKVNSYALQPEIEGPYYIAETEERLSNLEEI